MVVLSSFFSQLEQPPSKMTTARTRQASAARATPITRPCLSHQPAQREPLSSVTHFERPIDLHRYERGLPQAHHFKLAPSQRGAVDGSHAPSPGALVVQAPTVVVPPAE